MSRWYPDPARITRPAYRSLARAIREAVATGALRAGDRLPPQRDMAFRLGLSLQTVGRAYEALIRGDVVSGEVGRGTFIKPAVAAGARDTPYQRIAPGGAVIDCSLLTPVCGAPQTEALAATLRAMADDLPGDMLSQVRPRAGLGPHLAAATVWLRGCGVQAGADRVLVTNGASPALGTAMMMAAPPGSLVVTEAMGHHTLGALARNLGLRLEGLACDAEGLLPDAVDEAVRTRGARSVVAMPAGNGPLAHVMGSARRDELVAVARRHDLTLIENDAWGPIAPDRPAPLVARAPERTFHVSGLSKCLAPGLRIGWLVVPAPQMSQALVAHRAFNWMATPLMAEIARRWIADGTAEALLHWQRARLARRNRLAVRHLAGLPMLGTAHGLHVWLPLPEGRTEDEIVAATLGRGVAVANGSAFAVGPPETLSPGVRVCLGGVSEAALSRALGRISSVWRGPVAGGNGDS